MFSLFIGIRNEKVALSGEVGGIGHDDLRLRGRQFGQFFFLIRLSDQVVSQQYLGVVRSSSDKMRHCENNLVWERMSHFVVGTIGLIGG